MGMITINRGISPSQAANRLGTSAKTVKENECTSGALAARRGPIGGDAVVTTGNRILEEALRCAARGWPVFPLHSVRDGRCSCNKPDCRDTGKHPLTAHGLLDATTDEDQIRDWWERRHPIANLGGERAAQPASSSLTSTLGTAGTIRSPSSRRCTASSRTRSREKPAGAVATSSSRKDHGGAAPWNRHPRWWLHRPTAESACKRESVPVGPQLTPG